MVSTSLIRRHLQAAGNATPEELLQRIEMDPVGSGMLRVEKAPLKAIRSILSSADIARNEFGWCQRTSSHPLRFALANRTSEAPIDGLSPASIKPLLVSFFISQLDCSHAFLSIATDNGVDKHLPDIIGIKRFHADPDIYSITCASRSSLEGLVASTVTEEISSSNLQETLLDGAIRTRCAHERYVTAGRISGGPHDWKTLRKLSRELGIGVIQIFDHTGFVSPRIIHPSCPVYKPEQEILYIAKAFHPALKKFLAIPPENTFQPETPGMKLVKHPQSSP